MTTARSTKTRPTQARPVRLLPAIRPVQMSAISGGLLNGVAVDARLQDAFLSANRERTITGASELVVRIGDPDGELLRSPILRNRLELDLRGRDGERWIYDRARSIGGYDHDGYVLVLRLWDRETAALKLVNGARTWDGRAFSLEGLTQSICRETNKAFPGMRLRAEVPDPGQILSPVAPVVQRTIRNSVGGRDPVGRAKTPVRGFPAGAEAKLTVKGARASAAQARVIASVIEEAVRNNASPRVQAGAVMAVIVESEAGRLLETTGNDDAGYFQQGRPWISLANSRDPAKACRAFLLGPDADVGGTGKGNDPPGWKQTHGSLREATGDLGLMVAAIQRPRADLRGEYGRWEKEAVRAVDLWNGGSGETKVPRPSAGGSTTTTSTATTERKLKRLHRPTEWRRGSSRTPESSLTMLRRYAKTFGRRVFVAEDRLVIADDDQLILAAPHMAFTAFDPNITQRPQITADGPGGMQQITFTALTAWWTAPPGAVVDLQGAGENDGPWLVETLADEAGGHTIDVTLTQPATEDADQQTQKIKTTTIGDADSGARGGGGAGGASGPTATGVLPWSRGADDLVQAAADLAAQAGGSGVFVVSAYRPGSTTSSGNSSDHSSNSDRQAARDIAVRGIDALKGPPSAKLDAGVVAIGKALGRDYGNGTRTIIDTFQWKGYRVQIIWRTPLYGGHMGHIHIGARRT